MVQTIILREDDEGVCVKLLNELSEVVDSVNILVNDKELIIH